MISQIPYLVSEAFRGWKQHRMVIVPALVTIALCSLLLAICVTLWIGTARLLAQQEHFYRIEAFMRAEPDSVRRDSLRAEILAIKMVRSVQYRSPEEALEDFRRRFSSRMLDLVEGNPLPASFAVDLLPEYRDAVSLQRLVQVLSRWPEFEDVRAPVRWVLWAERWRFDLIFWPAVAAVLLLLILALIIGNAVRLTLYSRRILVENMKYAGGTPFFIQFPFVLEGLLQGGLGASLAVLAWHLGLRSVLNVFPGLEPYVAGYGFALPVVVVAVALIGAYASLRAVRSFLLGQA